MVQVMYFLSEVYTPAGFESAFRMSPNAEKDATILHCSTPGMVINQNSISS